MFESDGVSRFPLARPDADSAAVLPATNLRVHTQEREGLNNIGVIQRHLCGPGPRRLERQRFTRLRAETRSSQVDLYLTLRCTRSRDYRASVATAQPH